MIDNGYCTLADLKSVMRIVDNVDDAMLESRIEEASRVIDDFCDRRFYTCLLYTSPSPRDRTRSRMPSSA